MNYESGGTDEETATKTTTKTATKTATKTTKKTATKKTKVGPLSCTSLLYVSAA